ncbi:putative ankyrin repeat protein RF_0381 [Stegodyphus dumicola]|uniref:putative ankyrin repeat protein RF_0381 n=1 Tax=Stegodyphus dumicola TaxID=202533 RepID=UPI0015B0CA36|nr:putative ankyrin repeat protein RF_0381 [Stegodyphus dumicola]
MTASLEVIKFLTEKSPPYILDLPDYYQDTPFNIACCYKCPEVVQFLLSQGSVVAKNIERFSLLDVLLNVAENMIPIASLHLDAGANINLAHCQHGTLLMIAIVRHMNIQRAANSLKNENSPYVDLGILLIDRGCDVNAANYVGDTALHLTVRAELETVVRKILIVGSDIDRCNNFGDTPVHYACKYGNQRLLDLLIISGANLRALDREITLERWRRGQELNEKNTHLLSYAIGKSKQCLSLENFCIITIRKNIRNVENYATKLGLPPLLMTRLQLKD